MTLFHIFTVCYLFLWFLYVERVPFDSFIIYFYLCFVNIIFNLCAYCYIFSLLNWLLSIYFSLFKRFHCYFFNVKIYQKIKKINFIPAILLIANIEFIFLPVIYILICKLYSGTVSSYKYSF